MIEAGTRSQVIWGEGNWAFLDIGFARDAKSCGLLVGDGDPYCIQFGAANRRIVSLAESSKSSLNLVIEAPLSVCFNEMGNPKGRSIEKEGSKTRYWYNGLGCAVMVAALYLVRELRKANMSSSVRLFEGFVSYKDRTVPSDHGRDVRHLRDLVRDPIKFRASVFSAAHLKKDPSDELISAFHVADMDFGVPTVLKHQAQFQLKGRSVVLMTAFSSPRRLREPP